MAGAPAIMGDRADVLVVGAGLAGATAANELARSGLRVIVLDKGRGPGGRLSTRHVDGGSFDHGAASVQACGAEFRDWLSVRETVGDIVSWRPGHWVGLPGMSALVAGLLSDLAPRWSTTVAALRRGGDGIWRASDTEARVLAMASQLVLAVPATQARALLHAARNDPTSAGIARADAALAEVRYAPCWVVLLKLVAEVEPSEVQLSPGDGVIERAVRESSKPGRASGHWVLHATAGWSRKELECTPDEVAPRLVEAFLRASGLDARHVLSAVAHRWRFAIPETGTALAAIPELRLFLAGDAIGWSVDAGTLPPAECAWRSGKAAAEAVLAGNQPKS